MYGFLWIFFIYAFFGWCTEVAFHALVTGRFINRGFLNGPVCPIYGFGVVIVVGLLTPLQDNKLVLFLGSVVLTSALEWLTGFVLEKLFRQRWWDYSNEPFNLGGYICLRFSIAWGLACLLVMEVVHPAVLFFIRWLPRLVGVPALCVMGVLMAVDLAATVNGVRKLNRRLEEIDALAGRIREASDEIGQSLADRVLDLSEKSQELKQSLQEKRDDLREDLEEWKEDLEDWKEERTEDLEELRRKLEKRLSSQGWMERRLMNAFPQMRSLRHKDALERWKKRFNREK